MFIGFCVSNRIFFNCMWAQRHASYGYTADGTCRCICDLIQCDLSDAFIQNSGWTCTKQWINPETVDHFILKTKQHPDISPSAITYIFRRTSTVRGTLRLTASQEVLWLGWMLQIFMLCGLMERSPIACFICTHSFSHTWLLYETQRPLSKGVKWFLFWIVFCLDELILTQALFFFKIWPGIIIWVHPQSLCEPLPAPPLAQSPKQSLTVSLAPLRDVSPCPPRPCSSPRRRCLMPTLAGDGDG